MKAIWLPREMRVAPELDESLRPGPPVGRTALLINPFYAKDPHASFGKHVLTPTLALTSIAGATPMGWSVRYDTAHVVFRPAKMTEQQLFDGYAWCYQRLFSHRSIWRRRPADLRAVPAYLGMSYLYKRSNRYWHQLIRHNLTAAAWHPIVELTRRRHLKFRRRLAARAQGAKGAAAMAAVVLAAGV